MIHESEVIYTRDSLGDNLVCSVNNYWKRLCLTQNITDLDMQTQTIIPNDSFIQDYGGFTKIKSISKIKEENWINILTNKNSLYLDKFSCLKTDKGKTGIELLKPKDNLVSSNSIPSFKAYPNKFRESLSDLMWTLGYIMSQGKILDDDLIFISIKPSTQKNMYYSVKEHVYSLVDNAKIDFEAKISNKNTANKMYYGSFSIYKHKLLEELYNSFGIDLKSKIIPKFAFNRLTIAELKNFVIGFMDGNFTIHERRWRSGFLSKETAQQLKSLLEYFGCEVALRTTSSKVSSYLVVKYNGSLLPYMKNPQLRELKESRRLTLNTDLEEILKITSFNENSYKYQIITESGTYLLQNVIHYN